ncbi:MAG: AI-2E family transporter [Culicoidibacterales bacterium]
MNKFFEKYLKNRPNWRVINMLVILVAILMGVYSFEALRAVFSSIQQVATPFVGGFIIAFLFNPLVTVIQKKVFRGKLRALSALIVVILVAGIIFFAFFNIAPLIIKQLVALGESGTQFVTWISTEWQIDIVSEATNWIVKNYNELLASIQTWIVSDGVNYLSSTVNILLTTLLTIIISLYMLVDYHNLVDSFLNIFPVRSRKQLREYLAGLGKSLRSYIGALGTIIVIGATAFAIILTFFGVPNAIPLAIVINLLQVIPIFGTALGLIFVVIVTLPMSFWLFVQVIVTLLIYVQFESNFIQPKVYGRAIKVNDILILLALYVGSTLFGFVGMVFALPGLIVILHTMKFTRIMRWRALRKKVKALRVERQQAANQQ